MDRGWDLPATPWETQDAPAPDASGSTPDVGPRGWTLPAAPWEGTNNTAGPAAPPIPPNQGAASNTWTGLARGFGQLLGPAGEAGMIETQMPEDMRVSSGDIAKAATNFALDGAQPYQPQTGLGKAYQNVIADTVGSAPLTAMGPGGLTGLLTRGLANVGSSVGGEIGASLFPNHPVLARTMGSLLGGVTGAGLGPSIKAPTYPTVSQANTVLAQQGGSYWTPARIAAATDLNKQQAAAKIQGITAPAASSDGLMSRLWSRIPESYRFIPPLLLGEGALQYPHQAWDLATSHPGIAAALGFGGIMGRGAYKNPAQAALGVGSSLIGQLGQLSGSSNGNDSNNYQGSF